MTIASPTSAIVLLKVVLPIRADQRFFNGTRGVFTRTRGVEVCSRQFGSRRGPTSNSSERGAATASADWLGAGAVTGSGTGTVENGGLAGAAGSAEGPAFGAQAHATIAGKKHFLTAGSSQKRVGFVNVGAIAAKRLMVVAHRRQTSFRKR